MTDEQTVWEAFRHFAHLDHANAAIHTAPARYSPLTFRLAEMVARIGLPATLSTDDVDLWHRVQGDRGAYAEDPGR